MQNSNNNEKKIQRQSKKSIRIQVIKMGIGLVAGITIYLIVKLIF